MLPRACRRYCGTRQVALATTRMSEPSYVNPNIRHNSSSASDPNAINKWSAQITQPKSQGASQAMRR